MKFDAYEVSSAQKRIFLAEQLQGKSTLYNIPGARIIEGDLEPLRLEGAIKKLIQRHESLRTSFAVANEEIVQKVYDYAGIDFTLKYTKNPGLQKCEISGIIDDFIHPFDLNKVPLWNVELIKIAENRHLFLFDIHHIIADGISTSLIFNETAAFYQGRELPPLDFQYVDFTMWQNDLLNSKEIKKQGEYWLNQFPGEVSVLNMPFDFPRPPGLNPAGATVNVEISADLTGKLEKLALRNNATLFMLMLAAYNVLLFKYTGQEDIVIGTPVAGRSHPELEGVVGMFVNMLVLINQPTPAKSFKELLNEVAQRALLAYQNQDYPFEMLVEKLGLGRHLDRNPLFDTTFELNNYSHEEGAVKESGNLKFIPYSVQYKTSKFDFSLTAYKAGKNIVLRTIYRTSLFMEESMKRFTNHYLAILEYIAVTGTPDERISKIQILDEKEIESLLFAFNHTATPFPKDKTIHRLFEEQVDKTPHSVAVVGSVNELGETMQVTYGELNKRSNHLAHQLKQKGVQPDTIVGIKMERCVEMIIGILGILKAGGVYLPLDPEHPQARVCGALEDSRSPILLTQTGILKNHSFTALQGLRNSRVKPYVTLPCAPVTSMDSLPFPDRSLVNYKAYNRYIGQAMVKHSISLQGTRGCPYNCTYCHKIWPKKQVARSAENLYSEVKLYYDMGVRRFVLIDDIFNLNIKNSSEFFRKIVRDRLDVKLFFPNGLRGDILTEKYIDLMVEAGTINVALALETASPRLQKLIKKNLNLDKLQESLDYFQQKYPQVILELFTMHGFPTETEEEAMMTLDFIKRQKWLHFPYVHILKIYPNTDMAELATANGISKDAIAASAHLAYHQLPATLPFDSSFTLNYQADFLNNYFLSKQRLLHVLPFQAAALTQDELVEKYDSYLPMDIVDFEGLLKSIGIDRGELGAVEFMDEAQVSVPDLDRKIRSHFPVHKSSAGALRILFLDLSQYFSGEEHMLYDVVEPPLGLMYLLTYLYSRFGEKINGKIAKSRIDFDNYHSLRILLEDFKPDIIGIRTLTLYKDFFHRTVSMIRQWGIAVPILAGGPYASSDYNTLLQDGHIDLAVLGEGEIITAALVEKILENGKKLPDTDVLKEIPGIAFIPGGRKLRGALAPELIMMETEGISSVLNKQSATRVENPEPLSYPGDTAYIIFTSGSTGKPKGVMVEHRNVVRLLFNDKFQFSFNDRDVWTMFHSYCFDFSVWEMYGALLYGGKLIIVPRMVARDPVVFLGILKREQVTVLNQTPSAFYNLIEEAIKSDKNELNLRYVVFGGEALKPVKLRKWKEKYPGVKLINMFGITETTVHVTYKEIGDNEINFNISNIGVPIPTTTTFVVDRYLNLLPMGAVGELCVGGEGVARGYLNRPELTAEKFDQVKDNKSFSGGLGGRFFKKAPRIYRSGDLARVLPDGEMEYLGRIDQQVQLKGFRIEPGEIETRLLRFEGIKEAIVIAKESHDEGYNYLCAYIVPAGDIDITMLREYLAQILPDYMIPQYFIPLEKIPLTPNGKVNQKAFPTPEKTGLNSKNEYAAPRNAVEKKLVETWENVLVMNPIGINENFFMIGGDSIKAIQVTARMRDAGYQLEMKDLFQYQTISELAPLVKIEKTSKNNKKTVLTGNAALPPEQQFTYKKFSPEILNRLAEEYPGEIEDIYPLTPMQEGMLFHVLYEHSPSLFINQLSYRFYDEIDLSVVEQSVNELIQRHGILRTIFVYGGSSGVERPFQLVLKRRQIKIFYEDISTRKISKKEQLVKIYKRKDRQCPFDLSEDLLLRLAIIKLDHSVYEFIWTHHCILMDGWSQNVLKLDFTGIYNRYSTQRESQPQPSPATPYKTYIQWLENHDKDKSRKYWKNYLKGYEEIAVLPKKKKSLNSKEEFTRERSSIVFGEEKTVMLNNLARRHKVTLNIIFQTLWGILLGKYTGKDDVVFGSVVSGRPPEIKGIETMVGLFTNVIPVRIKFEENPGFVQLFKHVQEDAFSTEPHHYYPLVDIQSESSSKKTLFDHFYVFINLPDSDELQEIMGPNREAKKEFFSKLSEFDAFEQTSYDLIIFVMPTEKISIALTYNANVYNKDFMGKIASHIEEAVDEVIKNENTRIKDIEVEMNDLAAVESTVFGSAQPDFDF
jgi:amino acid adenylation domain-containing protein